MLMYQNFHLKFGNKNASKLLNPRIFKLSNFELTKQSAVHYISNNDHEVGPTENNALYKKVSMRIPLFNYMDIATHLGTLQHKTALPAVEIKKHIRHNRKFVLTLDLAKYKPMPIVPLVLNYSLINAKYRYLGNEAKIGYYKNLNKVNTLLKGLSEVHNSHPDYYNQWIFLDVPEVIYPISVMKNASNQMQINHYKMFGNYENLMVFELWKWLGNRREASIFKNIPQVLLNKINIVFTCNNVFTVYNLGLLNEWRKSSENPNGKLDPNLMGKQFLRMLITLKKAVKETELIELTDEEQLEKEKESNLDTNGSDDEVFIEQKKEEVTEVSEEEVVEDTTEIDIDAVTEEITEPDLNEDNSVDLISAIIDEDDDDVDETLIVNNVKNQMVKQIVPGDASEQEAEFDEVLSEKLDTEDVLNVRSLPIGDRPVLITRPDTTKSPETRARANLDEYAKNNPMTVSKFDGIRKALGKYKQLKVSQDEKMTVGEMIDVKPEELVITQEDRKVSSLEVFNKKYIKDFMERDSVAMIAGLQSAGVIIHDIKKHDIENISGSYTAYSVRIKPIEGEMSTIRIKVPKPDENGTFRISGNNYKLRSQRRDNCLRKIDSNTVSLTTYFGKTFVRRDESRIGNYEKWLIQEIRKAAFDKENNQVLETRSGDVFDNLLSAPYVYSLLSKTFRGITTKDCFIYLDHTKAKERFGEEIVRKVEAKGLFFCGSYNKSFGLGVDNDNVFHYIDKSGEAFELGTIEDLCGFNPNKAPVENIVVDIMAKKIPIGLVLSYKLGLSKLLAALDPKYYRTVPSNTRVKLEPHEYMIRFNDFNLILSRKDRITSLILAGLQKCEDTNKFSIYQMDTKEIYFNLLESIGIPGRYLKEIDLYYQMFVDPISERILIEMKEPTDFGGLLMRSVELLVNTYHRDEVDMTEQRLAGFERMNGEIYTQLVRAVREHNRHGIKANYGVELNPEAVWMAICTDTTKIIEESLNPVQYLKQEEVTTFGGNGGRSRQSMVKRTRKHHRTAIGVISESSVDNSDTGNTTYMSANPLLKNLYGMPDNSGTGEMNKDITPENAFSTNSLMSPCIDTDDKFVTLI